MSDLRARLRDAWPSQLGPRSIDYEEFERRFWARTERQGECLIWTGARRGKYGTATLFGRGECAHRVAYWLEIGPWVDGMQIDHLCNTPLCVNPAHLEQVTHVANNRRSSSPSALNGRKTHCKHGHEFSAENTRVYTRGKVQCRACRTCQRERVRRDYYATRRMA